MLSPDRLHDKVANGFFPACLTAPVKVAGCLGGGKVLLVDNTEYSVLRTANSIRGPCNSNGFIPVVLIYSAELLPGVRRPKELSLRRKLCNKELGNCASQRTLDS